ncbi:MAG: helix-turn-helix domain-containing protein [Mycobacterium sp.]
MTTSSARQVGPLLREWRQRQRLSQLELALDAGVSTRHLSFVETGRSKPGRDMLLRVSERLEIPFRERNRLLLAAGHAPAFPEHSLGAPELTSFREALKRILASHEPYPAIIFDRRWNLLASNAAMRALVEGVDPAVLTPPVNALRVGLEMIPRFINAREVAGYFRDRVQRQLAVTADDELAQLLEQIENCIRHHDERYPASESESAQSLGSMKVRAPNGAEWSFVCIFGAFDMPFEVTISELAIELLFPADHTTADAFQSLARDRQER